jgi:hypothetical protein
MSRRELPRPRGPLGPDLGAIAAMLEAGARRDAVVRDSVVLSMVANVFGAVCGFRDRPGGRTCIPRGLNYGPCRHGGPDGHGCAPLPTRQAFVLIKERPAPLMTDVNLATTGGLAASLERCRERGGHDDQSCR